MANLITLLSSNPSEITLTEDTSLHTAYTHTSGVIINLNGYKLSMTQPFTFQPSNPTEKLKIFGPGSVQWTKNNATNERAFILKSGFEFDGFDVLVDVRRYGSNLNQSAPVWFVEINAPNSCSAGVLNEIKLNGSYAYGGGFVIGTDMTGLSSFTATNNIVENLHGAFTLVNPQNAELKNNSVRLTSWGHFAISKFGTVLLENNQSSFPGNGTSGDSISIGSGTSMHIKNHLSFGGSCYGLWILPETGYTISNLLVEKSQFIGGGTAGVRCEGVSSSNKLGTVEFNRCVFAFNGGRGWEGRNITSLKMINNEYGHNNFTDLDNGSQMTFLNSSGLGAPTISPVSTTDAAVIITTYSGNKKLNRITSSFYPVQDNQLPYVAI